MNLSPVTSEQVRKRAFREESGTARGSVNYATGCEL